MDISLKHTVVVSLAMVLILSSAMASCTYTVVHNNQRYYDTMKQCIDSGGSFIPSKGDNSSAVCLHSK